MRYAATLFGGSGLFKSTSGGASWSVSSIGLTNTDVQALVIDPVTPTKLYAGTFGGGVFTSTDGGGRWGASTSGLAYIGVHALGIDPATPTTVYSGTVGGGAFRG